MTQDQNQIRVKLRTRSRCNVGVWLVDFVLCWLALCGFVNVVVGVASFTLDVRAQEFSPNQAPVERLQRIGFYCAVSTVGFAYMLWRNDWRFRLTTVLYLVVLWCAIYAAVFPMQIEGSVPNAIAVYGMALPLLIYCIGWANQRQRPIGVGEAK